ncbi:putative glycosyltransferase of unknown function [Paludisphaera borealis]|uniref:Glycosyltransferase RgtA/B/C/D-like domain-containing protein n=2 Tax=Paludisphaera borealis TaxID=1387353 RepID=A0A1U7CLS5_9BACT|nr:putative glycosyltransferase of unknown function [Paludisphaera borealis]
MIEPPPGDFATAAAVPRWAWMRFDVAVAALAVLSTLAVRLIHLDAAPYGGDERYVVLHALKFGTGDLNPRHFDWPASPFYYLTFFIDGCYFVGGYLLGWFRTPTAFVLEYLTNPRAYYFIPRAISAAFGLGTAFLLMKATSRMVDRPTGRLAGLLLLLGPLHLQMSRTGIADVPMAFFTVAALCLALRIAISPEASLRDYLLAGVMVGLATAMKYHGVLSASFVISADLYRRFPKSKWRAVLDLPTQPRLIAAGAASLLAFVVTTPFAVLDHRTFLADLSFQIAHQRGIVEHIGIVSPSSPIRELATAILPAVVGWPILLLSVLGFVIVMVDHRRFGLAAVMLTPLLILNLSAFLMSRVKFPHYLIPATPCLSALAAIAVRSITDRLAESEVKKSLLAASLLAAILITTMPPQLSSVLALGLPHTGTATMAWVHSNCEPGMKLALDDEEDLNFLPTTASLDRSIADANAGDYSGRVDYYTNLKRLIERDEDHPHYDLYRLHASDAAGGYLEFLQAEGVRYFIRSEAVLSMFRRNRPSPNTEERLWFYRDLEARGKLVATIEGDGKKLRGRAFQIFELPSRGR